MSGVYCSEVMCSTIATKLYNAVNGLPLYIFHEADPPSYYLKKHQMCHHKLHRNVLSAIQLESVDLPSTHYFYLL